MKINIQVYNQKQFTKYGKLKKLARSERGFMFGDVGETKDKDMQNFLKDVAKKLSTEYKGFSSPYIFTHLIAFNKETGEHAYIFESVDIGHGEITTSPTKLREYIMTN